MAQVGHFPEVGSRGGIPGHIVGSQFQAQMLVVQAPCPAGPGLRERAALQCTWGFL